MKNLFKIGLLVCYSALAFLLQTRSNFLLFVIIYSILFYFYFQIVQKNNERLGISILWMIVLSAPLFMANPILSDDVYRFIWDGRMTVSGLNPYAFLPSEINRSSLKDLFGKLNSPDYYSVYPPMKQYIFAVGAYLSGSSIEKNIFILRVVLLISLVLGVFVLREIIKLNNFGEKRLPDNHLLLLYNPLVMLETVGNLHFEMLLLTFLLASYYWYLKWKRVFMPSILFGLAVSVKLIPLMLLPLIMKKLGIKKGIQFLAITFLANLILLLPFLDLATILNFGQSLDLYFHSFEFNASVYYLIRELGFIFTGFNVIAYAGPTLGLISFFMILWLAFKGRHFESTVLFILFVHLIFSTTVHPWYIIPLVGISALTPFRFPYLWSFLIGLSYHAYSNLPVQENLWITVFAYLPVFVLAAVEIAKNENYRPKHFERLHF